MSVAIAVNTDGAREVLAMEVGSSVLLVQVSTLADVVGSARPQRRPKRIAAAWVLARANIDFRP